MQNVMLQLFSVAQILAAGKKDISKLQKKRIQFYFTLTNAVTPNLRYHISYSFGTPLKDFSIFHPSKYVDNWILFQEFHACNLCLFLQHHHIITCMGSVCTYWYYTASWRHYCISHHHTVTSGCLVTYKPQTMYYW